MTKLITILLLLTTLLPTINDYSPDKDLDAILKLAKYTSWPDDSDQIRIAMAAKSDDSMTRATIFLKNKYLDNKPIVFIDLKKCDNIDNVDIVFIESDADIDVEDFINKVGHNKIMTVSNNINNLAMGCMFYVNGQQDELEYLYNRQAILNSGLMIKSSLLNPAHSYENMNNK